MSVIRKKPFIESVIEDLTDEQKASLLSVMNGSEATVNASFTDLPEDDVAPVLFQLEPNNLKTGILIQAETYDVLLAYHRFQDMQIYNLDLSKFTFEKINEYLDINELRRVLSGDVGTSVVANPELAGTESSLTGLEVDGTKYKIPEGTVVEANPTLAGTEDALTGLQVGDTKYKVGGGACHLYSIYANGISVSFNYISDSDNLDTYAKLAQDLYSKGFISDSRYYTICYVSGFASSKNVKYTFGLYSTNGSTIKSKYCETTFNFTDGAITINVSSENLANSYAPHKIF